MRVSNSIYPVLLLLGAFIPTVYTAYAVMSIDLGNQFLKVGIVKPGVPMETVLNREFKRKTSTIVGLRKGERFFSDAAMNLNVKFPLNTYSYIIDVIGKKFDDPAVELYQKRFPEHKIHACEKRNTVIFETEAGNLHAETILAMILWNANEITNVYAGQKVSEAIMIVPSYYTHAERDAILVAAEIANINVLSIITDGSALGLNYGVFRMNEINETKQNMLVYNVGASKTSATIIEYEKIKNETAKTSFPNCKTLGFGFDRNLGGFELTLRLRDHLVKGFQNTHKTKENIKQNPRAMAKLLKEAERVKTVLSANNEIRAQVENLFEEKDFKLPVTRSEFLGLFAELDDKWTKPIDDALAMAGMTLDQVDKFVLFGGGTRVPKILDLLEKYLGGKEIGRFLNTDEAASLGAVYHGAYLTKGFQVKKFGVEEMTEKVDELSVGHEIEKMDDETIREAIQTLKNFETNEREQAERDAAQNTLEALVYSTKDIVENEEFIQYGTIEEVGKVKETAVTVGNWLEDDVTLETKTEEFKTQHKLIEDSMKIMKSRQKQHNERPKKLRTMRKVLNETMKFMDQAKNMTEIITVEDLKTLQEAYDAANEWYTTKRVEQKSKPLNENPIFTIAEISEKTQDLKREWKFLENKLRVALAKIMKEKAEKEAAEKRAQREAERAAAAAAKNETGEGSAEGKVDGEKGEEKVEETTVDATLDDTTLEDTEDSQNTEDEAATHDASDL
uniref:Hypoxia up-regulated protein 1 n=1 Tax=Rhabditophanes sp. KR3021 TaxID=114890 RepID=A0AC35U7N0_9BILA